MDYLTYDYLKRTVCAFPLLKISTETLWKKTNSTVTTLSDDANISVTKQTWHLMYLKKSTNITRVPNVSTPVMKHKKRWMGFCFSTTPLSKLVSIREQLFK